MFYLVRRNVCCYFYVEHSIKLTSKIHAIHGKENGTGKWIAKKRKIERKSQNNKDKWVKEANR